MNQGALQQVSFYSIQSNLVQLEGAIAYQNENGWGSEHHVIEKLDDVMEGIGVTYSVGSHSGVLNKEKEQVLWRLQDYLDDFVQDSGYPNVTLNEEERGKFIKLGEHLRSVGWGMNRGYSGSWESLEQKTMDLIQRGS